MDPADAEGLKSRSQMARRVTENWADENLYCSCCDSESLRSTPANTQAVDFTCPECLAVFQLKAGRRWSERKVPDAGFDAMMRALASDAVPNLLVMQYTEDWKVENLLIIPSFFFTPAAIEKRKPLGPQARRAGWIGCNIVLSEVDEIGKIRIVKDGAAADCAVVRKRYEEVRPLANLNVKLRGWTLDVLRLLKRLDKTCFTINDAYSLDDELGRMYPSNNNIRPKIRQQLQVLRDLGFIRFVRRGEYEFLK